MVKPPANLREVDRTTLTWDQLRAALALLSSLRLRDWILIKLDMSSALRPSELFPLRWRCLGEDKQVLDIQETIYKGKVRPYGKTKGSLTKVPVADVLVAELVAWRAQLKRDAGTHLRIRSCFRAGSEVLWIRATIETGSYADSPRSLDYRS